MRTARATHVPVGHDQQQHLEFARECVTNFNHAYGNHLVHPETIVCMLDASIPFLPHAAGSLKDSTRPAHHVPDGTHK